ncbi:probable methyltransferase-like protein 24 isoform X1 [Stegostoma tigrinum]|uniref:probable methyltransferase-like protein 24 isoform X1 n=2 Tax=Stegostoma tigrinum TaxID=3053191 RepID=UPI00202BA49A|nr:probable methyltransferase-like protein 24 isoform X1 [Stegostoma tigrinum]
MPWRKLLPPPVSVSPRWMMPLCLSTVALLLLGAAVLPLWTPGSGLGSWQQVPGEVGSAAGRRRVTGPAWSQSAEGKTGACCSGSPLQGRRKSRQWHIELQPWVSSYHSLEEEAARFLAYISSSQISCGKPDEEIGSLELTQEPWPICLDSAFHLAQQIHRKQCRVYSIGLGSEDKRFEVEMAKAGCEVHYFDPSINEAHIQKSAGHWYHRMAIDWRDPNPAVIAQKQHRTTKRLATIMSEFGHRKIDVLKADIESAEWKILENLILENVIEEIGQLVFAIHLHWPGFEISGNDTDVVRYWYSLLKELELRNFKLFHSYKDLNKPQIFLRKQAFNASSSYVLSWINTQWR